MAFGFCSAALAATGFFLLLLAREDLADLRRKALADPAVVHGLDWGKALFWVPFEKAGDKVAKVRICESLVEGQLKVLN